jgi:hypothetical protein
MDFKHYFVVLFAIPVATFCRVDRGSEAEVDDGANVYPNGPKDVQADSNTAIWGRAWWSYTVLTLT